MVHCFACLIELWMHAGSWENTKKAWELLEAIAEIKLLDFRVFFQLHSISSCSESRPSPRATSCNFFVLALFQLPECAHLRNSKHFPCFHTVIKTRVEVCENEKLKWEHEPVYKASVSTQFRVLPNFHECFYDAREPEKKCFLFSL